MDFTEWDTRVAATEIADDSPLPQSDMSSPAPVPSPTPVPLPFGITWEDLAGALPGFAGDGSASVSHVKRGRHQGGHPSVIMTLSYVTSSGGRRERTLFFKRNPDDSREAEHYRFLIGHGVSVPDLVVSLDRADHEVLALQFLPSIGLQPGDVDDLLQLVATLNSLEDVPTSIATTPPGMPPSDFEQLLDTALESVAGVWPEQRPDRWLDLYRRVTPICQGLPRALTHGELAAQQIGRSVNGRLVLFDLATVGERPRFADVANVLEVLARLSGDARRLVLSRYLHHLSVAGGPLCSIEEAWAELRITRFVQELEALPWRTGLDDPGDLHQRLVTIQADYAAVLGAPRRHTTSTRRDHRIALRRRGPGHA